jgi:hypothetical protein
MPNDRPETREEWFCRLASEVVQEQKMAELPHGMDHDLWRFIHFLQEKVKAEERQAQPARP